MKPFSLENVLQHRKRQEDIARGKFAEAKEVVETIHQRHQAEQQKLDLLLQEIEERQQQGIDITTLIHYQDHVRQIKENITAIRKTLKEKEKLLAQTQQNLLDKVKEKQIMEQLKEKQNREWQRYLDKKEALMLDEIAVMRHRPEE